MPRELLTHGELQCFFYYKNNDKPVVVNLSVLDMREKIEKERRNIERVDVFARIYESNHSNDTTMNYPISYTVKP